MEAWARGLTALSHQVKPMPPAYVDADSEIIARTVPI